MLRIEKLKSNLNKITQEIVKNHPSCTLVCVSKYQNIEDIRRFYDLGVRDFAESRVVQLLERSIELKDLNINWHMIGKIQSNKINKLLDVENLKYIHSIDSINLLLKLLNKKFQTQNIKSFFQVNISHEDQKSGFDSLEEVKQAVKLYPQIYGVMGIGMRSTQTDNFDQNVKNDFTYLQEIKEQVDKEFKLDLKLSLGMSSDFKIALKYKSDFIRIGSLLFS